MRAVWLVGLAACGRIGFDPVDAGDAAAAHVCASEHTPLTNVAATAELAVTTVADGLIAAWTDGANVQPVTMAKLDLQRKLVVASSFPANTGFVDHDIGGLIETTAGVLAVFATDITGDLWLVAPDLSTATYAVTPVGVLAHDPFVPDRSGPRIAYLTGYQGSVSVIYIREDGALLQTTNIAVAGPVSELSGNDGDAVWVEDLGAAGSRCSVGEILYAGAQPDLGSRRVVSGDCVHARGAVGPAPAYGPLVAWQTAGGTVEARYYAASGELSRQLSPAGRAPRVRFDGTRFWIAWIDHRSGADQLQVATFDLAGKLSAVLMPAAQPVNDQAFALLRAGTAVQLLVLGAGGLDVTTLCSPPDIAVADPAGRSI